LGARPAGSTRAIPFPPEGGRPPGGLPPAGSGTPRRAAVLAAAFAFTAALILGAAPIPPAAAAAGDIALQIDGRRVETDVPPIIVDGRTLVPVRVISENLGATVDWDAGSRTVIIVSPAKRILLPVDRPYATVNGEPVTLDVPARVVSGRTLVPIRFVSETLDAVVDWVPEERLVKVFSAPPAGPGVSVQALTLEKAEGVARFALITSGPVDYRAVSLDRQGGYPDRILVDISGASLHLPDELSMGHAFVQRVRAFTQDTGGQDLVRVVFDLEEPVRYSAWATWDPVTPVPPGDVLEGLTGGRPAVIVEVQYKLLGVDYAPGSEKLVIHLNGPVEFQPWEASNPWRLVLDLQRTTLASSCGPGTVEIGEAGVARARYAQFQVDPDTTRVVLDAVAGAVPYSVIRDGDDVVVYFGAATTITGLGYEAAPFGGRLLLEADRPLRAAVEHLSNPTRLRVTVAGARLTPTLAGGGEMALGDDLVASVAYAEDYAAGTVALTLTLNSPAGTGRAVTTDAGLTLNILRSCLAGKIIVIDPGHGPGDPGAIGPNGVYEEGLAYDISVRLASLLREAGAEVHLTRTATQNPGKYERPALANALGADACVSVHLNANTRSSICGTETYYWKTHPASRRLAEVVLARLVDRLGRPNRGARYHEFVATRDPLMPSCLVECLYMSNPEDLELIMDPQVRQAMAEAIFDGLWEFFSEG